MEELIKRNIRSKWKRSERDEDKQLVGAYDSMTHSFPNRPYSSSSATVDNNPIKLLKHVNASMVETTSHHHPRAAAAPLDPIIVIDSPRVTSY
jgi:hypothetical protein